MTLNWQPLQHVESKKLLVKVKQKLPPFRPPDHIALVQSADIWWDIESKRLPALLPCNFVDLDHLEVELVNIHRFFNLRRSWVILPDRGTHAMGVGLPALVDKLMTRTKLTKPVVLIVAIFVKE